MKDGECIRNFIREPETKMLRGRYRWTCGDRWLKYIEQE